MKTYNFESNNICVGYRENRGHTLLIYNRQNNAFRIKLTFKMILFNTETGEYHYSIPHFNSKILEYSLIISNQNEKDFSCIKLLKLILYNKPEQLDLQQHRALCLLPMYSM